MELDADYSGVLAVALANTRHHDGHGGLTDDLARPGGALAWVSEQPEFAGAGPRGLNKTGLRLDVIRDAMRSLFADAVLPHPQSRQERSHRMPAAEAFAVLRSAADALGLVPVWELIDGQVRAGRQTEADGSALVTGVIAVRTLDFLCGDQAGELRSCQAPHCVRYFVRSHGRQEWCKVSCANRARAARFAQRRQRLPTGERTQCWIRPPTGTGATWPAAGMVCARARPMSTSDDRRRQATSGTGVQTDSAISPLGSGRSWPPVMRVR